MHHCSVLQGGGKTDTLSKIIAQYDPGNTTSNSLSTQDIDSANTSDLIAPYVAETKDERPEESSQPTAVVPGLSQFEFDLGEKEQLQDFEHINETVQGAQDRKLTLNREPGIPPSAPAPLAPAFQYGQTAYTVPRPEFSDIFSNGSYTSYGDTRNLLQLPQSEAGGQGMLMSSLQPSSSYSQPEAKILEPSFSYSQAEGQVSPRTPQAALEQAELIFDNAATQREPNQEDIPAMWGRRSSVDLLRKKRLTDGSLQVANEEKADWETIAGNSQKGRTSLDSIADYSSSEGSRNSLGLTTNTILAHCGLMSTRSALRRPL
ncbi:hypothetical protein N0V94_005416 [Neodidymelliopsis sp. IMI 364377]|nr:hypothetical protein N0V94_005416 [Neodidymelliopsis sp. IMI 364377]